MLVSGSDLRLSYSVSVVTANFRYRFSIPPNSSVGSSATASRPDVIDTASLALMEVVQDSVV